MIALEFSIEKTMNWNLWIWINFEMQFVIEAEWMGRERPAHQMNRRNEKYLGKFLFTMRGVFYNKTVLVA